MSQQPPIWEEEELRAFCRAVLTAFPWSQDHSAQQGTLAGQQPAGGCAQ